MTSEKAKNNIFPRFYRRSYPRSMGITLILINGFLLVINILAMMQDDSIGIILYTIFLSLLVGFMFVIGVLSLLASMENIRITPEGFSLMLGNWAAFTVPTDRIRSIVATSREYRQKMSDRNIYLLRLYWNGKHPQNFSLYFQWSAETETAIREAFPGINMLL